MPEQPRNTSANTSTAENLPAHTNTYLSTSSTPNRPSPLRDSSATTHSNRPKFQRNQKPRPFNTNSLLRTSSISSASPADQSAVLLGFQGKTGIPQFIPPESRPPAEQPQRSTSTPSPPSAQHLPPSCNEELGPVQRLMRPNGKIAVVVSQGYGYMRYPSRWSAQLAELNSPFHPPYLLLILYCKNNHSTRKSNTPARTA